MKDIRQKTPARDEGTWLARQLDAAGRPFTRPAAAWKAASDRRAAQRSEESRAALYAATRAQRDALRDLRRDRKAFENARDEVEWWNVFNGERRAARAVVRDSRALASDARAARRQARANYPVSLAQLAVRCHAAHIVPTTVWAAVSDSLASDVTWGMSLTVATANLVGIALGLRHCNGETPDDALEALQPSQEERDLLQRLDPKVWHGVAEPRGLADVLSAGATLTPSGVQAKLTLQGGMTLTKLNGMTEQLRAALRLNEKTRLELRPGATGGHARLTLRTRSVTDGVTLDGWNPGDPWAVSTSTGTAIPVILGERLLVAGSSGSGKSWSLRPLLAEASEGETEKLVLFDAKGPEAGCWRHRARVAVTADEMLELSDELVAEMTERNTTLPPGHDVVEISARRPRITIAIDEGGEVLALAKDAGSGEDKIEYSRILTNLRSLARMGRSAGMPVVYCTQKPTMSGAGAGLDSQIAGVLDHILCMYVKTVGETRVVFGEEAGQMGYDAHRLPKPGHAYLSVPGDNSRPEILKLRAISPKDAAGLPPMKPWSRRSSWTGTTEADVRARKTLEAASRSEGPADPWGGVTTASSTDPTLDLSKSSVRMSAADRDDQIIELLRDDPCKSLSEVAKLSGASKSVVKKSLERMEVDGLVRRDEDGCWWVTG